MRRMTTAIALSPVGLLPPAVLRAYLIGCVPLFVVYMVATETDGDLSRGFQLGSAVLGTLRNAGAGFLLLLPVWPYTGWLERRRFGVARLLANHAGMALVFAVACQFCSYWMIWATLGFEAAQSARERWFIWQAMFDMLMYWTAAGGFTAYRAVVRARAEAAASVQAQTLLARAELAALRNKLNPHFLFNTLHSIIALTRQDPARAEGALLMFSDMLRYVLDTEKADLDEVPLRQELYFTRDYLALEALRLGHRLTVDWQLDDAAMHHPVPALSIQPLVENSIKHAFNPRSMPGRLTVSVRVVEDGRVVAVAITDDGPGCSAEALASAQGLGLKTVTRRLQLQHGEAAKLRIDNQPGHGFSVHFNLPVGG